MRPVYIISVENGKARLRHGKAGSRLVNDFQDVIKTAGINNALIYVTENPMSGKTVKGNVPREVLQGLRNVLQFHG